MKRDPFGKVSKRSRRSPVKRKDRAPGRDGANTVSGKIDLDILGRLVVLDKFHKSRKGVWVGGSRPDFHTPKLNI